VARSGRGRSVLGSASALTRARKVRVLLMDVDGVLTDGHVYLQSFPGDIALEMKAFHSQDGAGLKLARIAGLRTGIITGRESAATTRRAQENGMEFVYQGSDEKGAPYQEILRRAQVSDSEVAFIGDDLPDLPVLRRVGLAVAVANAVVEVKSAAHLVTKRHGGEGAVREVIEFILKAQGKWLSAVPKARA
jgi:3-deoxy-D-manno-octulosonate 8-phosphate phosphatase (KDO 8-P phosphatase)